MGLLVPVVHASPEDNEAEGAESSAFDNVLEDFNPDTFTDDEGRRMSWWERSIAGTMWRLLRSIVWLFQLEPIESLIFSLPMQTYHAMEEGPNPNAFMDLVADTVWRLWGPYDEEYRAPEIGGIFYQREWRNIVLPPFAVFQSIAFALIAISVVVAGLKMAASVGNPLGRAIAKENLLNMFISAVMIGAMIWLVVLVMDLNLGMVDTIARLIDPDLTTRFGDGESSVPTLRMTEALGTGSWFLTFLLYGFIILFTIYFNVLYLLRKFVILVLIIVGPLVIWAWNRGHQTSFYLWLSELISNIFMQSAHALVFVLYFNIAANVTEGFMGSPAGKLFLLLMLVPTSILLRRLITGWFNLLGLDEEKTAGSMFGGVFGGATALVGIGGGVAKAFAGGAVGAKAGAVAGPAGASVGAFAGFAAPIFGAVTGGIGGAMASPVGSSVGASGLGRDAASMGTSAGFAFGHTLGAVANYGASRHTRGASEDAPVENAPVENEGNTNPEAGFGSLSPAAPAPLPSQHFPGDADVPPEGWGGGARD